MVSALLLATAGVMAQWMIYRCVLLPSFEVLERDRARLHSSRVESALEAEYGHLRYFGVDWGTWDDACQFIEDGNADFIKSNLGPPTFEKNDFDLIGFYHRTGRKVWFGYRPAQTAEARAGEPFEMDSLPPGHSLLRLPLEGTPVAGLWRTPQGPMLLASVPIVTSENKGPVRGVILMGRRLDEKVQDRMHRQTGVDFRFEPLADGESTHSGETQVIRQHAYFQTDRTLRDLDGRPILRLRTTLPRDLTAEARSGLQLAVLAAAVAAALMVAALAWLIQHSIVAPLLRIQRHAAAINGSEDLSRRLTPETRDEVGLLGDEINLLLDRIEAMTRKLDSRVRARTAELETVNAGLRESEERFRGLFEGHGAPMLLIQPDSGQIVNANEAAAQFYGYSREQLRAMRIEQINQLPPEEIARQRRQALNHTRNAFIFPHRLASGAIRAVEVFSSPVTIQGRPVLFSVIHDITDRKLAEENLRRSEARYRMLHESLRDAFVQVSMEGRILECNELYSDLLGYSPGELRQLTHQALTPQRWHALDERILREQILPRGYSDVYEKEYRRKDGTLFSIELRAMLSRDEQGLPVALWALVRDITERKRTEKALRESEERFRLSMEATSDGLWDWSLEPDTVYFSPSYYRILGHEPDDFPSSLEAWKERLHPDDSERTVRMILACVEGPTETFEMEYRMRARDGQWKWILSRGRCIRRGEHGRALRLVGTHVDITARKQTELQLAASFEELRQAQQELVRQERLATLGKLAGCVAHEMRTPLSVIRNSSFFLELCCPVENHDVREALDEVNRAIASSDQIITEMLDFVREPAATDSEFCLTDAISEALRLVPLPEDIRLRVPSQQDRASLQGRANQDQVTRILVNLIQNAVQAMPDGGRLSILSRPAGPGSVRASIRDSGCGIRPEDLGRIFEPLFSTKPKGIGLGLAIAKRYAERNRGELTVESEPGHGTTFHLSLESAPAPPGAKTASKRKPDARRNKKDQRKGKPKKKSPAAARNSRGK